VTSEQLIGFLGLFATVVFGALSVYLFLTKRYPGQITLVDESTIALFDAIVKNVSDLAVLYRERPVSEGLVLFRGAFVNTGSKDIAADMVRERLSLRLPDNFTWRSAKVVSSSPAVQTRIELTANEISFDMDLFRCKEFIRFEAVVEVPVNSTGRSDSEKNLKERLHQALQARHRIADTQNVRMREFPDEAYTNRQLKKLRVPFAILAVMILIQCGILFFDSSAQLRFIIEDKGEQVEVKLTPRTGDMVKLTGVSKKEYAKSVPAKDFFNTPGIVARTVRDRSMMIVTFSMIGITLALFGGLFLMIYRERWQAKRLRRALGLSDET
jgi:hypothetical protein